MSSVEPRPSSSYAKVLVLVAFAVAGLFPVRADRVSLGAFDGGGTVLAAAVLFLAYEGFGLMANTAEEIQDPQRNLPRAFMVAVTGVVVVYVAVSFVAAGVADHAALVNAKDYALVVAAGAVGGSWAFTPSPSPQSSQRQVLSMPPSTARRG